MKKGRPRLLVADDHPLFRDGVVSALEKSGEFEIVAELSDGQKAFEGILEEAPEVALVDLDMPRLNGMELAKKVAEHGLACRVVIVSMHKHSVLIRKCVESGVSGYLIKDSAANEIVEAVRAVVSGKRYFTPSVAAILVESLHDDTSAEKTVQGLDELTPAERKVLRLVASDRTSKEIAVDLGVSVRTIENHRGRAARKLGLSGVHSLVKFAFEHRDSL